jgi:O-antigen ligase
MSGTIKIRKSPLELLTQITFVLFLFAQIFFDHTAINQIAMVFMCGMVVVLWLAKRKFHFNFYFILTLFFICQSLVFSYNGISINSQTSLNMTNTLILNFIISLALFNYILITNSLEKSLYAFAKIGLLFSFFIVIFSFENIFGGRLGNYVNIDVFGKSVQYNANGIAIITGFSYLIYLYKYHMSSNRLNLFILLWLIFIVLLSGSRKGILLLVIGTCLLLYLLNPQKRIKNVLTGGIIVIALYWSIMYMPPLYDIIGSRMESLFIMFSGNDVGDASIATRNLYIERGWNYFLARPWTGYGLDCFRDLPGSYGTYSHNNFIELLVSGGILSFLFYYYMHIVVIIKLYNQLNVNNISKFLFVISLLLIIMDWGMVTYYERINILLFIFTLCGYQETKKACMSVNVNEKVYLLN